MTPVPINTNAWNRIRYSLIAPVYDRIARFRAQRRRSIGLLAPQTGEQVLLSGAVLHLIVAVAPDGGRVVAEAARVLRPGGLVVILDKFVPAGARPSLPRRLLNLVTSVVFSHVTRRLGPMLDGTGLRVVRREPAGLGGRFEIVLLEKSIAARGDEVRPS